MATGKEILSKHKLKLMKEKATLIKKRDELQKKYDDDMKIASDKIGALESEVNDLSEELRLRSNTESYIICVNESQQVTDLTYTPAYNERVEVTEINGINLLAIVKTSLYGKFKFIEYTGNEIKINEEMYNKYKLIKGVK